MKLKNNQFVLTIGIVVVLCIGLSIITTSITGNVIKAKTSYWGVETYTKAEIDDILAGSGSLSAGSINDTYTKSQIDNLLSSLEEDIIDNENQVSTLSTSVSTLSTSVSTLSSSTGASTATTATLECVTGYTFEHGATMTLDKALYTSVRGNTYVFNDVFEVTIVYAGVHGAPNMRCKQENGWILTGCNSAGADGYGNEQWLLNANECRGEHGGGAWVSARCCKIV